MLIHVSRIQIDLALDVEMALPGVLRRYFECNKRRLRIYPNREYGLFRRASQFVFAKIEGPFLSEKAVVKAVREMVRDAQVYFKPQLWAKQLLHRWKRSRNMILKDTLVHYNTPALILSAQHHYKEVNNLQYLSWLSNKLIDKYVIV